MDHWLVQKDCIMRTLELTSILNKKKLWVSMIPYFQEIVDEFPEILDNPESTPAGIRLFDESYNPILSDEEATKMFRHVVAKILWGEIHARPDLT
jgi:hypothetical protein